MLLIRIDNYDCVSIIVVSKVGRGYVGKVCVCDQSHIFGLFCDTYTRDKRTWHGEGSSIAGEHWLLISRRQRETVAYISSFSLSISVASEFSSRETSLFWFIITNSVYSSLLLLFFDELEYKM